MSLPSTNVGINSLTCNVDSLAFFYANSSGHLVSRFVRINDVLALPAPPTLPESHSSSHLPLPNPFKVLSSRSTDHIPDTEKDPGIERVQFAEEIDRGEIGLSAHLLGLRGDASGEDVRLCAWASNELRVCHFTHHHFLVVNDVSRCSTGPNQGSSIHHQHRSPTPKTFVGRLMTRSPCFSRCVPTR